MEVFTVYDEGHNSHYHVISITTSSADHNHGSFGSESLVCGYWPDTYHDHLISLTTDGAHYHTIYIYTSTESATDVYHTHTFSGSAGSGGGGHTHSAGSVSSMGCEIMACTSDPHTHSSVGSCNSGGAAHTHTISGVTGYGYGTLYWHYHSFSGSTSSDDYHTHTSPPSLNTAYCHYSRLHSHGGGTIPSINHTHSYSGNTEYAGEPPPLPTKKTYSPPVL